MDTTRNPFTRIFRAKWRAIWRALHHARLPILSVALTYFAAALAGIIMAHSGMALALDARDRIVGQAYNGSDAVINAMQGGKPLLAALTDFGANLFLGAAPSTVAGIGILPAYPLAAYRGWVGGIVSVDGSHASRLANPGEAAYYLATLILQLIPYALAGGAGVHLGLAYYRSHSHAPVEKWYYFPRSALADAGWIYLLVVPLFLIASLFEFLGR